MCIVAADSICAIVAHTTSKKLDGRRGGGQVWRPAKRPLFAHFFSWGVLSGCVQHPSKNSLSHEDGPSQVAVFPTSIAAAFAASPEEAAGAGSCNNLKKKKQTEKGSSSCWLYIPNSCSKPTPKKKNKSNKTTGDGFEKGILVDYWLHRVKSEMYITGGRGWGMGLARYSSV